MDRNRGTQEICDRLNNEIPDFAQVLARIETNDPEYKELPFMAKYVYGDFTSMAYVERLGVAVGQNPHLKNLKICPNHYWPEPDVPPVEKIEAFCRGLVHNKSIRQIHFSPNLLLMSREIRNLMTSFFANNPNLTAFAIYHFRINEEAWEDQIEVLRSVLGAARPSVYAVLYSCSGWGSNEPTTTEGFCEILGDFPNLEELILYTDRPSSNGHQMFDNRSCSHIVDLLEDPHSKLRVLNLREVEEIEDDAMTSLLDALKDNKHLKKFLVDLKKSSHLKHLLNSLRHHNHTLELVKKENDVPSSSNNEIDAEIESLLQLNEEEDDKDFIRIRKALDYDFLIPNRPFLGALFDDEDFDRRLTPFVLGSIGTIRNDKDVRSEKLRRSALFHFIRSMPLLVVKPRDKKRKLQDID